MQLFFSELSFLFALASGLLPLVFSRGYRAISLVHFSLLSVAGICAVIAGSMALFTGTTELSQLPLGLPWINWHLRLDALSGLFLFILGMMTFAVALYGPSHIREYGKESSLHKMLALNSGLFVAGMLLVLLANDIFSFMVAWEVMSLSSYFLVAYQHPRATNRRAAFIYLLMAHMSGLFILLAYGILAKFGHAFDFVSLRDAVVPIGWIGIAFLLAFIGFGMKSGLVPLHAWLPEAHPVAPSHISALMSGVMLKIAIYGLIRFVFYLVGELYWQWGVLVLTIGVLSALLGILYAVVQTNLKQLLAYSSVENMGIICIGLGISMIFYSTGHPMLGALGLVAALYHCINHAIFKSLLFLGAGAIIQHTHEGNLERMGGLIHRMPQTAMFFLIGYMSIAALPPLNGFVSEWLIFQTALQAPILDSGVLRTLIPVAASLLALSGALAAVCFVKVYGISFLGQPRSRRVRHARDPHLGMRAALGLLALLCLFFGVFAPWVVQILSVIPQQLMGSSLPVATSPQWLWLTPISAKAATYAPLLILIGIIGTWGICFGLLFIRRSPIHRVPPWSCGMGSMNARMQYTATAFSMPIQRIFHPVWRIEESVEVMDPKYEKSRLKPLRYRLQIEDWFLRVLYQPLSRCVIAIARQCTRLQGGNLRVYVAYSFFTLVGLLLWLTFYYG